MYIYGDQWWLVSICHNVPLVYGETSDIMHEQCMSPYFFPDSLFQIIRYMLPPDNRNLASMFYITGICKYSLL